MRDDRSARSGLHLHDLLDVNHPDLIATDVLPELHDGPGPHA
ncbi:hypothetical protein WEI85_07470 [Actinomycetes bacterium KLBMP 9797]